MHYVLLISRLLNRMRELTAYFGPKTEPRQIIPSGDFVMKKLAVSTIATMIFISGAALSSAVMAADAPQKLSEAAAHSACTDSKAYNNNLASMTVQDRSPISTPGSVADSGDGVNDYVTNVDIKNPCFNGGMTIDRSNMDTRSTGG